METLVWILTGIVVGWLSYSLMRLNTERGMLMSMAIGAVGALVGAKAVAPVFVSVAGTPGEIALPFVLFAAGAAVGLLALGDLVLRRFGV